MKKFALALSMVAIFLVPAPEAHSQQFIGVNAMGVQICSGPLGPGPCADVFRYLQQQAAQNYGGFNNGMGGGMNQPGISGLPGAGMLPQDGQIVAAIAQQCGGNPACMAGSWGAVEIQRCRNGIGNAGGCFGPNGEIMRVVNRVLPHNLQPGTIINNVQSDLRNGPGANNDLVGCNGALNRAFGGSC